MSNSVWPHRQQPTRLPCPWDSPGKNTGVGCHFLLQCMKVKSESEVAQSCPTLSDPTDCSLPGSSAHGIFQARVLEWVAIAFSKWLLSSSIQIYSDLFHHSILLQMKVFFQLFPYFPQLFSSNTTWTSCNIICAIISVVWMLCSVIMESKRMVFHSPIQNSVVDTLSRCFC